MRTKTEYIVIHCAATPPDMDIGADEIRDWHTSPSPSDPSKPWSDIGYHDVIRRNGIVEQGRQENDIGAHVRGYNSVSVGICLVGGINEDGSPENNFTPEQVKSLIRLLRFYRVLFPSAAIVGHNQLDPHKACPSFNVSDWAKEIGIF